MRRVDDLSTEQTSRLWVVPLVAGVLPAAAALGALWLFSELTAGPECNPFVEGCVSISRTARYGVANHLFRVLILPAAALQAATWVLCGVWLSDVGAVRGRTLGLLPWVGVAAPLFLAVYAILLGTGGEPYDVVRVYGMPAYFGGTYLCMVITAIRFRRRVRSGAIPAAPRLEWLLLLLALFATGSGIVQIFLRPFIAERSVRTRLTNVLEWNTGLAFSLFLLGLAWLWYRTRFTVEPAAGRQVGAGPASPLAAPHDGPSATASTGHVGADLRTTTRLERREDQERSRT